MIEQVSEAGSARRVVVAVIGLDMPGIVAAVSQVVSSLEGNLEEVSQVTLHGQFALIGLVGLPAGLSNECLEKALREEILRQHLHQSVLVRDYEPQTRATTVEGDAYVVSVWGPDRNDIIATFARIFAEAGVNIESLRAFPIEASQSLQVFEVRVPAGIDPHPFQQTLAARAREMGLRANMQHRDIFEAIHRVRVE